MKVEVEKQPDSVSTLQIELPPEQVAKEWNAIADNFARYAKIPGYRPGKAPRRVIEAKFKKEIQEELTKKLVSKSYRDAVAEKQLRVVSLTNLEDVKIGDDKTMRFRATVITAPEASKNLHRGKKFWLRMGTENFLPNFCEQLVGQKKEETRLVIVTFPADLPVKELAGKKADYAVTLREIKQKVLPELDDAFAT